MATNKNCRLTSLPKNGAILIQSAKECKNAQSALKSRLEVLALLLYNLGEFENQENDMLIARVVGDVVSTMKDEKLSGRKLLIVREVSIENELVGKPIVAVDTVDAGEGDVVLVAQGSSARQTSSTKDTPTDAVIMAIVDSVEMEGKVTFRKGR